MPSGALSPDQQLLARLTGERQELPWLEFKENLSDPVEIGEYISALSNAAVLSDAGHGYLVWGVRDSDHAIVGTTFDPLTLKGAGNDDLAPWLTRLLSPQVFFHFRDVDTGGGIRAVILEIDAARSAPIAFKSERYVRIGSYKKHLSAYPEHESRLWEMLRGTGFEAGIALGNLIESRVLELLDYPAYFELVRTALPETRQGIVEQFVREGLVGRGVSGDLFITNLGALLFARELLAFAPVARKAVRVVRYVGSSRAGGVAQQVGARGYASGFSGLLDYIGARLPTSESIERGLRQNRPLYPERAVRELVANTLIHQDLSLGGSGPIVESSATALSSPIPVCP